MEPALRPAILLVDDDATLRSVLSRHLTREGFTVRTASSGHAALGALAQSWPALIVVDLMMPGMDGFELSQRIKRIADLPIIVLSAVDADQTKIDALQQFAEDYIVKPFSPDELVARIHRVLRRAAPGRAQVTIGSGDLEIDLSARRVSTPAGSHPLTPTEVRFVQVLLNSLDRTVPTETLLDRVWSDSDGADSVICVGDRPPPASQAGGGPRSPPIPADRAGDRLPLVVRLEDVDLGQPALRLFAVIAVVALPGLAALALVLAFAEAWVAEVGVATAFLLIGLATLAWGGDRRRLHRPGPLPRPPGGGRPRHPRRCRR